MVLNEDFREFIALLNANQVKYLVVGGYAVAFYGHPRYTKDLDFWIWPDPQNAIKLIQTLQDFGFASLGVQASDFLSIDNIIQLGQPPNRIDLITSVSGLDFETAFSSRNEEVFQGLTINFLSLDDLVKNKTASGRLQDLADVQQLKKDRKED